MKTIEEIVRLANRNFQNRLRIENPNSPETVAHEIAKNSIPSSSKEILLLAARNLDLALEEPLRGPAFDGRKTAINLIASNIQEAVYQSLVNPQESTYAQRVTGPLDVEGVYQELMLQLSMPQVNVAQESHSTPNDRGQSFYTKNLYVRPSGSDGK